ncbi:hypothetical protein HMPREF0262_02009 [Clostridium sp. ATCC 29733]|nr:hypothetical protein HMPREF0262_02009 [Clostridium sp. ATCC 29733]
MAPPPGPHIGTNQKRRCGQISAAPFCSAGRAFYAPAFRRS